MPTFYQSPLFCWLILPLLLLTAGCSTSSQVETSPVVSDEDDLRGALLTYLRHPRFAHDDFCEQAFGIQAKMERYDRAAGEIYFSTDSASFLEGKHLGLCANVADITFGERRGKYQVLDKWVNSQDDRVLMRIPAEKLRVDTTRALHKDFGDIRYTLSMKELLGFSRSTALYNGPVLAEYTPDPATEPVAIANHCATITPFGEPSLQRLVDQLTAGASSQEAKAQALLDFVTNEIGYTGLGGMEIFFRPNEVIFSQKADCSGKTVLYASLLEQAKIPYMLVYLPSHICVAVQGDFPTTNDMHFTHEGIQYTIAETTAEGFVIGESLLQMPITEDTFEFLQYPGKRTRLYDLAEKDSLPFLKG